MTDRTPRLSSIPRTPQATGSIQDQRSEFQLPQDINIPDTLQWSRYIHSGSSLGGLPAIPSQCLLPSDNGSMTSSTQAALYRPFGGHGLNTLDRIPEHTTAADKIAEVGGKKMQIYEDAHGNGFLQSLTEVATPSARTSQDPYTEIDFGKNVESVKDALDKIMEVRPQTSVTLRPITKEDLSSQVHIKQSNSVPVGMDSQPPSEINEGYLVPRLKHIVTHLADYPRKIENHEQRLDLLENASFSNAAIEELQETDERIDNRVCDLEDRIIELEKGQAAINDASSVGSRHVVNTSFNSRASVTSSAMIAAAIDGFDVSRVEALEAQVAELQAASLPSHSRPWEVEVVFLPFGTQLMGVWSSQHSMTQRSRLNSTATDEWTQTQHSMAAAQACLTAHDQASAWENSAMNVGNQEDTTWLMAKACALRSRVDERLRSRGLVKAIQVFGPDARDVQSAMLTALGDLPDILAEDPYTQREDQNAGSVPKSLKKYLGLHYSWIPLRKLHKDSCLRFLNPSEMVTPALWTTPFLTSSVVMRHKTKPRLYVTHRDSYIQHLGHDNADWTWQKLRQLPRVYPDQPAFSHTPEADAHEPCWEYDERLDPPQESIHSSFSSLGIRSPPQEAEDLDPASPSDHFSSAPISPRASTTPTSIAPPTNPSFSPLKERNPFRPIHTRTISMPTTITTIALKPSSQPHSSKRRISSFEHSASASPTRPSTSRPSTSHQNLNLNLNLKRRRTRSPSRAIDTPRWSLGPPSPYTFHDEVAHAQGHVQAQRTDKRERTPFAYATPHSNAPYIERPRSARRGSTTEELTGFGDEGDEDEEGGGEERALSDFDEFEDESEGREGSVELGSGKGQHEEWGGVLDEPIASFQSGRGQKANVSGLYGEDEDEDGEGSEDSTPSEYPSRQVERESPLWSGAKPGFRIHVDEGEL
ncbi:hypothetical protein L207DRAFT_420703 [Hyaloscypha variabilis F]|uniref:Uncharacterized protein n=1 Tax=Hyaloscypha variabilis (strain UAMH 11265 / GT02V1 / F) TaxID=1149755 RepID=A0A2J6S1G5_HYAVF|nr:hypothetical protein L207DRAFT_420703 [Hyaloscypha variabilis F]